MKEVDCRKCINCTGKECIAFGKDAEIAAANCAEDNLKNYVTHEEIDKSVHKPDMKCTLKKAAEVDVNGIPCSKDCCDQETCCDRCGYEDCMDGCDIYAEIGSCYGCEFMTEETNKRMTANELKNQLSKLSLKDEDEVILSIDLDNCGQVFANITQIEIDADHDLIIRAEE